MEKLVVCIMGQNCERFIDMCLDSVRDADAIVYCDGGSSDWSVRIAKERGAVHIHNKYDQSDKTMNGKQRNFYLNYLKENFKGWNCLVLDADEVLDVGGITKIKEMIENGK